MRFLCDGRAVVGLIFAAAATRAYAAQPVRDELLRLAALRAIFPGMTVERQPGRTLDTSWSSARQDHSVAFPDTLRQESFYHVTGAPIDDPEECAAEDLMGGKPSSRRLLRLMLFQWPRQPNALVAIIQFKFDGANPALGCSSIARLVRIVKTGGSWTVQDRYTFDTTHHSGLQAVQMTELTGDGVDELIVEADYGGAGVYASELTVFNLSGARIRPWKQQTQARLVDGTHGDEFVQQLDVPRTRTTGGRKLCVIKTVFRDAQRQLTPPRVTQECVEAEDAEGAKGKP